VRQAWYIAHREFWGYFNSPVAYVSITVFLILSGLQFMFGFLTPEIMGDKQDFFAMNEANLRIFFEGMPLLFVVFLPAISMRLMSEENRSGTLELLVTLPVRDNQIILGKYLASLFFLLVTLAFTLPYVWTVSSLGNPDLGPIIGGYFGLFLIGAAYLAIGLMTSVWTSNQIVAFVLAALFCGGFYFVDSLMGNVWESTRPFFEGISFKSHFRDIARGVIDTRDLVFFLSLIGIALLIANHSLESRRWRS
jgi:ABC-2 type transport system permease protein